MEEELQESSVRDRSITTHFRFPTMEAKTIILYSDEAYGIDRMIESLKLLRQNAPLLDQLNNANDDQKQSADSNEPSERQRSSSRMKARRLSGVDMQMPVFLKSKDQEPKRPQPHTLFVNFASSSIALLAPGAVAPKVVDPFAHIYAQSRKFSVIPEHAPVKDDAGYASSAAASGASSSSSAVEVLDSASGLSPSKVGISISSSSHDWPSSSSTTNSSGSDNFASGSNLSHKAIAAALSVSAPSSQVFTTTTGHHFLWHYPIHRVRDFAACEEGDSVALIVDRSTANPIFQQ